MNPTAKSAEDYAFLTPVKRTTGKEWLSVLEASFIIYRLPPHFKNFSKRLVKSPKLYFVDTGLLCWLLGIRSQEQLSMHAMRGPIFENWVISEFLKRQFSQGEPTNLYFWRDSMQLEIDLIVDNGNEPVPIEIKSGATTSGDQIKPLEKWLSLSGGKQGFLIYGGENNQKRQHVQIISWREFPNWVF